MEKLRMETKPQSERAAEKIARLFPSVVQNGKVDFEKLKAELTGETTKEGDESYDFTWVGKRNAISEAHKPIRKTLRPAVAESKNWETTENLYIEGDNLEVLKLLQESYLGKIKMIYIDPPYNTGKDFIYRDNFTRSRKEYEEESGAIDEETDERLFRNTETNGRFHSDWCSMMYPRLKIARDFLTDDGVIFISIDDNEVANLRKICNEVFGEENFVAEIVVQINPRGRHLDRYVAKTHEYLLVYCKNFDNPTSIFGVPKEGRMIAEYDCNDKKGKYRLLGLRNRNQAFNPATRPKLYYPLYINPKTHKVSLIKNTEYTDETYPDAPDGTKTCWTWSSQKVEEENEFITAEKTGNEWRIYRKDYILDENGEISTTLLKSLWIENEINNDYGRKAIKELFDVSIMDFPKPMELISRAVAASTRKNSNDLILDFFSGSSTTAHAVMQLNAEDGGRRKFIMVQLPEETAPDSEAYKAGYKNICEIGKERIRRAGEKITRDISSRQNSQKDNESELALNFQSDETICLNSNALDVGFRVLKLDETNMKDIYFTPAETTQDMLFDLVDNIKNDRDDLDLLYGVMIDWGLILSMPHIIKTIGKNKVHSVNDDELIACFDMTIPEATIREIAALKPRRVVFRDGGFKDSPTKINATEIFKTVSPDTDFRTL